MIVKIMTKDDVRLLHDWISGRLGKDFPCEWIPETGLSAVYDGKTVAVSVLYLEKSSGISVCGWFASDPELSPRRVRQAAVRLLMDMPLYARNMGAAFLMTTFGNRGINRILDRIGYVTGDKNVEHKIIILR